MMEYEGAHAGLGIHHHPFGQTYADLFGPEKFPDALLVVKIGARGVSQAVPLATITSRETFPHRHGRRIRKAPVLADAPVKPFRGGFRRFDGQRLQRVSLEEPA